MQTISNLNLPKKMSNEDINRLEMLRWNKRRSMSVLEFFEFIV